MIVSYYTLQIQYDYLVYLNKNIYCYTLLIQDLVIQQHNTSIMLLFTTSWKLHAKFGKPSPCASTSISFKTGVLRCSCLKFQTLGLLVAYTNLEAMHV